MSNSDYDDSLEREEEFEMKISKAMEELEFIRKTLESMEKEWVEMFTLLSERDQHSCLSCQDLYRPSCAPPNECWEHKRLAMLYRMANEP